MVKLFRNKNLLSNIKMANIDESLYSRQIAEIGMQAMCSLTESKVIIINYNAACIELCKNLALGGVGEINLVSDAQINVEDLSANYYASEEDLNKKVVDIVITKLSELNPYVKIINDENYKLEDYNTMVLCNSDLKLAIDLNKSCRKNNIKFIWMNYYGLFSNIFCDFGDKFSVIDIDGEQNKSSVLHEITNEGVFICIENEPHYLSVDNKFILTEVEGLNVNKMEFTISEVISNLSFKVKETKINWSKYKSGGRITSIKESYDLHFEDLNTQIDKSNKIINLDNDSTSLHKLFLKLLTYKEQFNELPEPWSIEYNSIFDVDWKYSNQFHFTSRGIFLPLCSIIGGYAAQECIKSITKKYTPINQWFYCHCFDILPDNHFIDYESTILGDRYDGMRLIFGNDLLNKIRKSSLFIVGSGAIGCEHLKNFSMTGIGTVEDSKLIVTDMDTIEKSNLNRQFLFRSNDIGKLKSEVAAREIKKMNEDTNIEWHKNKICKDTENLYNRHFFNSIDGVANALDNVEARLYVDSKCIWFDIPLFESGTLGTKANVQTIIPRLSEHYGASQDPPEKSFPVCTIKNFPNSLDHTIHWARNDFEELFVNMPNDWISLVNGKKKIDGMSPNEKGEFVNNINYLWRYKPSTFKDCIFWAFERFYDKFYFQIKQLLHNYPKDTSKSNGSNFWSGGKRCPDEIKLNIKNKLHNDYIYHTSILLAEMFSIKVPEEISKIIKEQIKGYKIKKFVASNDKVAANDEEEKELQKNRHLHFNLVELNITSIEEMQKYNIKASEFEKDDDLNHHIDYITATSNLRAFNYKIDPTDRYNTKIIAGKIIPAISTTTSIVSGLVTIEIVKKIFGKNKLDNYKNTFINLALSFTLHSEPMPCEKNIINNKIYTQWDFYEIRNNLDIKTLFNTLTNKYGVEIDTIMCGSKMLISPMTGAKQKTKRLKMTISDLLESFNVKMIKNNIYELQIASLMGDDEIDLPNIKYFYSDQETYNINKQIK